MNTTSLAQLKSVNYLQAAITGLLGTVASLGLLYLAWVAGEFEPQAFWILCGGSAVVAVITALLALLYVSTGRKVTVGRWRLLQTLLAIVNMSSQPPVGLAYGLFAMTVCWSEQNRAHFTGVGAGRREPLPTDSGDDLRLYNIARAVMGIFGGIYSVLLVGLLVGFGQLLAYGGTEPRVTVTERTIDISGMYGTIVERQSVVSVELRNALPAITFRTNGFALGGILKGWFDSSDRGKVLLLVDAKTPPFVYVQRTEGLLILGFRDPTRTRKLYESLGGTPAE